MNSSKVLRVIVNADDLGISVHVNSEIFRLIEAGRVTSATLIANAPSIKEACARLSDYQQASFGIHLNLTEFAPLLNDDRLSILLDNNGHFDGNRIRNIQINKDLKAGINAEWRAQIGKLRDLNVPISHIDSHHHIHTTPYLLGTLKSIQDWSGISAIRISKNVYTAAERPNNLLLWKKRFWNLALRKYKKTRTTQAFTDFKTMNATVISDTPPARTIELMVHPGNSGFVEETLALELEWWERFDYKIEMMNYRAL